MAQNVRSARRAAAARKVKRTMSSAQVHIFASFNNTIITVTDAMGAPVCWGSSGAVGYKGLVFSCAVWLWVFRKLI